MRNLTFLFSLIFICTVILQGCNVEDEKSLNPVENAVLEAKVGNKLWIARGGKAYFRQVGGEQKIEVSLGANPLNDPCLCSVEGDEVFFTVENGEGVYPLHVAEGNVFHKNSRIITFFEPETFDQHVAAQGFVEVLSVRDDKIECKIDARFKGENYLKGVVEIPICK